MITIIDYGMGNLRSVQKAFERVGIDAKITRNSDEILNAEKLVLPGVGNFEKGMNNIRENGLINILNETVISRKTPILGICLGMQLMTNFSEEGSCEGFGWVKSNTKKFSFKDNTLKIPHMGWNNLVMKNFDIIFKDVSNENYFYFVHSYYVSCDEDSEILAETTYGNKFISSFKKDNIYGCQFHPEKSHEAGLKILKNFAEL